MPDNLTLREEHSFKRKVPIFQVLIGARRRFSGTISGKPLLVMLQNNNMGAFGYPAIKVDDILIEQTDTPARNCLAD